MIPDVMHIDRRARGDVDHFESVVMQQRHDLGATSIRGTLQAIHEGNSEVATRSKTTANDVNTQVITRLGMRPTRQVLAHTYNFLVSPFWERNVCQNRG